MRGEGGSIAFSLIKPGVIFTIFIDTCLGFNISRWSWVWVEQTVWVPLIHAHQWSKSPLYNAALAVTTFLCDATVIARLKHLF